MSGHVPSIGQRTQQLPLGLVKGEGEEGEDDDNIYSISFPSSPFSSLPPTLSTSLPSTPFPIYEQALEDFGIPFVTVAGSGFYERPEVRDLLNILRALADPWDDQALAGMLRSPALGISDVGLVVFCAGP